MMRYCVSPPRQHTDRLKTSHKEFGFTNPVLVDEKTTITAGHGRVAAAKLLAMEQVPTNGRSGSYVGQSSIVLY